MYQAVLILASASLIAGIAPAQQETVSTSQSGASGNTSVSPTPLGDGSYALVSGVTPPHVSQSALAVYPVDAAPESVEGACILALIVGANGAPTDVSVVRSHGAPFDDAAIDAVKHTKFRPGMLNDKPVAVHVTVRVHFSAEHSPAVPMILSRQPIAGPGSSGPPDVYPKMIASAVAEYSDEARKARVEGTVVISLIVTEDGYPVDAKVVRSVGSGLDEKALEAIAKYRFKPAMKHDIPVPTMMSVEVRFRL